MNTPSEHPILRLDAVGTRYNNRWLFRQVSLTLPAGVYALTGANGAGKSSCLRMLAGLQPMHEGRMSLDGLLYTPDQDDWKQRIGYASDKPDAWPSMRLADFFELIAGFKRTSLVSVLDHADRYGLSDHLNSTWSGLSLGTRKKAVLVSAWAGEPAVLLLDEPSIALDHAARTVLIEDIQHVARRAIVLAATHDDEIIHLGSELLVNKQSILQESDLSQSCMVR
ncbi:ATP-binding cassette domain-containing protein [Burkholderiaceae bacterium DAT-1]|nr:ATP-binding cassette domain-containing protein [Burkholderiaceae bacterium DAT-1]